jgi:crotonobetainyl-CoA:carnitine CoA-transferase CaiB-like acyl-CoA transferase
MALLDVAVSIMANQAMNYFATDTAPPMMGNAHVNLAPYAVFDCADGWIILATGNDAQYQRLCRVLGLEDMAEAPAFRTNADRIANREEMTRRLTGATVTWAKADLLAACEAQGIPAGPINDLSEVFADPQVQARRMRIDLAGIPGVRSPFTFSDAALALTRPSPRLGEDQALIEDDDPTVSKAVPAQVPKPNSR